MADETKQKIIEILDKTFTVIDQCYNQNKEPVDKDIEKNCSFCANESRIIFPCYSRESNKKEKDLTRISEQELRFVFIEQFNKHCPDSWYYSVETPTVGKYRFTGVEKPHKTNKGGQSAMTDVCIHNETGKRICLIEFKFGNPEEFSFTKDLVKLKEESGLCFFVHLLKSQGKGTLNNIVGKVGSDLENTVFICHTIEGNKTQYISISNEEFSNQKWEPINDDERNKFIKDYLNDKEIRVNKKTQTK